MKHRSITARGGVGGSSRPARQSLLRLRSRRCQHLYLYNKSCGAHRAAAGPATHHAASYLGVYADGCPCLVRRGDSVRERYRGQARCGHVLQRMV